MNLTGRSAIVTGAGGPGCGRAIARRLAREGASVVVTDIDEAGARQTLSLIEAAGGRAALWLANVAVEAEVRALIEFAESTFGGLDVVVNNASGPGYHPEAPFDHWTETIQTDLFGAIYMTLHSLGPMRHRGGGPSSAWLRSPPWAMAVNTPRSRDTTWPRPGSSASPPH